jgi:hypothetical protein
MLEKLMNIRLSAVIPKNSILTEAQNGFREGKSIGTAIHDFLESIQKATEKKR